jgi:hypothetical protein
VGNQWRRSGLRDCGILDSDQLAIFRNRVVNVEPSCGKTLAMNVWQCKRLQVSGARVAASDAVAKRRFLQNPAAIMFRGLVSELMGISEVVE